MKRVTKRYQYWWHTGGGYTLQEFETPVELLDLIANFPTPNFYVTERVEYLPLIDFREEEGKK